MITITLNQILAKHPCADGWAKILHARGKITEQQMLEAVDGGCVPNSYEKLADDEAFPLAPALESNGLDDVQWSLRCLPDDHRLWRKYAVWCARQVQHLMTDPRSINALDVADRHADGLATDEELDAAHDAARAAARAAAWDAAWDAARAAQKSQVAANPRSRPLGGLSMIFYCERIDSGSLLIVEHEGMQFAHLLRDEELRGHFDKAFLFWKSALGLKFAALGLKKGRQEIFDLSSGLEAIQ